MSRAGYALTCGLFAVLFLISIIVYGNDTARAWAVASALLAAMSQYAAQDERAWRISIALAWLAFLSAAMALLYFTMP